MEENNKDWQKRKLQREQERNRMLRLEKAGILTKQARLRELEKKVAMGLEKIPANEKEKLRLEENKKKRFELQNTKSDLWKLRSKEKRTITSQTHKKIIELGDKAEKIAQILQRERERTRQENENKERQEREKITREQKRKEKIQKAENLERRWALLRWVNEYIAEN